MCRPAENGGRRCNKHNAYGVMKRNLQAQKQYHAHKLENSTLTDEKRSKSEAILAEVTEQLNSLTAERKELGVVKAFTMPLTPSAERVISQLESDGFSPYVVGGSVRDALLGLDSKDVDIEVYGGDADSVANSLRRIGKVDEVGKSFGVLKIRIGKEDFDVSLPRIDSKIGDGHRGFDIEVNPNLSLEEATARRDFTINALMYSHRLGFIIDKHNGLKDMEDKKLRHVSDAFDEDPLRVLRGVQMASRFGMDLHEDTIVKARTLQTSYKDLAIERVQMEFQKLYDKGKRPDKALKLLKETSWEKNFAGLENVNDKDLQRKARRMQELHDKGLVPKGKMTTLLSATLAHRMDDKNRYKFLADTTVGSEVKNAAYNITNLQLPRKQGKNALRNWAYDMPRNVSIRDWALFEMATGDSEKAETVLAKAEKLGIADHPEKDIVTGNDLMQVFPERKPGPWMKEALGKARNAQYANLFRDSTSGINWMKSNIS